MGLDIYIFKVSKPTPEQLEKCKGCTWDDISTNTGLSAFVWNEKNPDHYLVSNLGPYGIETSIPRKKMDYERFKADQGFAVGDIHSFRRLANGLEVHYYKEGNREMKEFTAEELLPYETTFDERVLLVNEEQIYYWRKDYDVQDYFYENYLVDNCMYVPISQDDLYAFLDEDEIPDLEDGEQLFYHEWY